METEMTYDIVDNFDLVKFEKYNHLVLCNILKIHFLKLKLHFQHF